MVPLPGPLGALGTFNPFGAAGDLAGKVAAEGWTGVMMALWTSGLWLLKWALALMDLLLTPDISSNGPGGELYRYTFWIAAAVVTTMSLVQFGTAAFKRDGKSLARVGIGWAQYGLVWSAWISYGAAVIAACGGLTSALMTAMLDINSWSQWQPMPDIDLENRAIEITMATVLGGLGIFMWVAAIGHFVVMMARALALLILTAVTPIAAAGLVSDVGRSWFWKSFRWFHATAFTPVVTVLVMGVGVKFASGVGQGGVDSAAAAVGTAIPSIMLILISVVAPVALFKLLAFVDPGTSSGAAMRAGMSAAGGLQGLLGGGSAGPGDPSSAASTSTGGGQSQGEAQSNAATANRFGTQMGKLGGVASLYSSALGMVTNAGATGAAMTIDDLNQTAVGDSSYFPDYQRGAQRFNPDQRDDDTTGDNGGEGPDDDNPSPPIPSAPTLPPSPPAGQSGGHGAPPNAGAGGGAEGAGISAAEVPPVV